MRFAELEEMLQHVGLLLSEGIIYLAEQKAGSKGNVEDQLQSSRIPGNRFRAWSTNATTLISGIC